MPPVIAPRKNNTLRPAAEKAAASLPGILAEARRTVATYESGAHTQKRAGTGEDFWQFRDYAPPDAPASIDWRQSAKSERIFVRQKERQTLQTCCFWSASGPGMRFRSSRHLPEKGRAAAILLLALALLHARSGEKVALFGAPEKPDNRPGALDAMARRLAGQLFEQEPEKRSEQSAQDLPGIHDLAGAPKGCSAVLAGDFTQPPETLAPLLARTGHGAGSGVLLHVMDPAERLFPYRGRTVFYDPRTNERLRIDDADSVRAAYLGKLSAHIEALRALCRQSGWHYVRHDTDAPYTDTLGRLAGALRERSRT